MKRQSKRFQQTWWTERLVPALMVVLLLALVATLAIVALSLIGVI